TGRKNWLFTGSAAGGRTMAILFSVVSSCQSHGHDPFVYLRDVLTRLPELPKGQLVELLPDRWRPAETAELPGEAGRKGCTRHTNPILKAVVRSLRADPPVSRRSQHVQAR